MSRMPILFHVFLVVALAGGVADAKRLPPGHVARGVRTLTKGPNATTVRAQSRLRNSLRNKLERNEQALLRHQGRAGVLLGRALYVSRVIAALALKKREIRGRLEANEKKRAQRIAPLRGGLNRQSHELRQQQDLLQDAVRLYGQKIVTPLGRDLRASGAKQRALQRQRRTLRSGLRGLGVPASRVPPQFVANPQKALASAVQAELGRLKDGLRRRESGTSLLPAGFEVAVARGGEGGVMIRTHENPYLGQLDVFDRGRPPRPGRSPLTDQGRARERAALTLSPAANGRNRTIPRCSAEQTGGARPWHEFAVVGKALGEPAFRVG